MTTTVSVHPDPAEDLRAIVGDNFVYPAGDTGVIDGVRPRFVVEPGSADELARVLALANAGGLRVIPRGGGTKLDWGSPPRGAGLILSTRRLNRVLEHAAGDMTATAEAGCTVAALQEALAQQGQRLALDPMWPERATIGGVLAANDAGPLRRAYGSARDLLIGVTAALPDGTLARSGGRVVKNVAGYDLPKLFTGSLGTLGIVVQATFRLHPLPRQTRNLSFAIAPDTVGRFIAAMDGCAPLTAGAQVHGAGGEPPEADVRVEGPAEAVGTKADRVIRATQSAGARQIEHDVDVWAARERLFEEAGAALVCKVGLLPTQWPAAMDLLARSASDGKFRWRLVAQTFGVGLVRLDAAAEGDLPPLVQRLRQDVQSLGGSLVVLHSPAGLKSQLDVWGDAGTSLPLMRRIKQQFDPAGTLNPGRFVGGI